MKKTSKRLVTIALISGIILFISCRKKNKPPYIPLTPAGYSSGSINNSYNFRTSAIDPDDDSVVIRFDWGNGDTSNWSSYVSSGQTVAMSYSWSNPGTYYVKAQAKDDDGAFSNWSSGHQVSMSTNPPDTPAIPIGPSEGMPNISYEFSSSATDPDGDSVAIRFDWGSGDTSNWSSYVSSGQTVTMSHSWSNPGTYYVKAQAKDDAGAISNWSSGHLISIGLKWRYLTGYPVYSSPAIGLDGTIYFGSTDDTLYALNPDGTLKWQYPTGGSIRQAPAIGSDGTIYFGSTDNYLYALNPDGTLKWQYQTGGDIKSSPAIGSDGTIYFGSNDNYLYAINPDGTLKWRYQTGGNVESSPAIGLDGTIYFGSTDDTLYALNPDGTLKWQYQTGGDIRSSPAIGSDGTVYFGSNDNYLYAINPDGTLKWRYLTGDDVESSPAIGSDNTIYFGSEDNYLYALNPDSTLKWQYQTGGDIKSSPAIGSDGTIYFGSDDNYLYAINPDGRLKWRYLTGYRIYSSPTIDLDGTVYFGSNDNYLYAIQSVGQLANTPWPKFRHDLKNTGRAGGP